jgi:hypothetical protein
MMQRYLARLILVVGLVVAVAGRAEAQEFGLKGGIQFTDVAWGDEIVLNTPWGWGAVGGMFMRLQPAKALPLQIEALVTQLVVDFSSEGADVKNTLTNLQVPVMVRYTVMSGSSTRIRVQGGAAFDVLLLAREDVGGIKSDIRDSVAPWGASLVVAGEFEWGRWVFDGRYLFGLTDLYSSEVSTVLSAKQRAIQATVGWKF